MKQTISLRELFTTFFRINAVTFGGGYTIVPVIRDEFMKKKGLIDEDEMLDIVALAQSGPGAMAISTSLLTGYKLRGVKGRSPPSWPQSCPLPHHHQPVDLLLSVLFEKLYRQIRPPGEWPA